MNDKFAWTGDNVEGVTIDADPYADLSPQQRADAATDLQKMIEALDDILAASGYTDEQLDSAESEDDDDD